MARHAYDSAQMRDKSRSASPVIADRHLSWVPFGERVRERRRARALTQVQLAKHLGVTVSTVRRYEAGRQTPSSFRVLLALRQALGAPLDYLLCGAGVPQLGDRELARLFVAADALPDADRALIVRILAALLPPASHPPRPAP
jgi:transcriptional regulator with XRE-family HTH domain